jgi:hypothetical protein
MTPCCWPSWQALGEWRRRRRRRVLALMYILCSWVYAAILQLPRACNVICHMLAMSSAASELCLHLLLMIDSKERTWPRRPWCPGGQRWHCARGERGWGGPDLQLGH